MACKIFSVGHILVDMRVRVNEFVGSDQFSEIRELTYGVGGSAANVAIGATRLGGSCTLLGKIGIDEFGRMAIDELMKEKISLDYVRTDLLEKTGFTIVMINRNGNVTMYGSKGASERLTPDEISTIRLNSCEYVHIASIRMDTSIAAADLSKKNGLFVAFDPGRELINQGIQQILPIFPYIDLLILNQKEAFALTGYDNPETAAVTLRKAGARIVIVKLGERGVYFLSDDAQGNVPPYTVEAVDTTGAGDAFITGLLISLGEKYTLRESILYANAVAAIKVTRLGSHTIPNKKEVEDFLSSVDN